MSKFRFQTWHFIVLFFVMIAVTSFVAWTGLRDTSDLEKTQILQLNRETFNEKIQSGTHFILIRNAESDLCDKMEANLNLLAKGNNKDINFYKIDAIECHKECVKYEVSAIPTVLVLNNGEISDRIMGVVPVRNLELIYNRNTK